MNISVCINTKNNPEKLRKTLRHILSDDGKKWNTEIIIIDQSTDTKTRQLIGSYRNDLFVYVQSGGKGTGYAKNEAIRIAKNEILAFTDDDCIPSRNWLKNIHGFFLSTPEAQILFGKTLPYKPQLHIKEHCPCTMMQKNSAVISVPAYHADAIGYSNNMAIRKCVFSKMKEFKNWLGPGSIGENAEDAEFALRAICLGIPIHYEPSVCVYHNKWLTQKDFTKQQRLYVGGEMACYEYFAAQNYVFATTIVSKNLRYAVGNARRIIKNFVCFQWNTRSFRDLVNTSLYEYHKLRGFLVGWYFARTDPIRT